MLRDRGGGFCRCQRVPINFWICCNPGLHFRRQLTLIVGTGLVTRNPEIAQVTEHGADVLVLQFDGTFGSSGELREEGTPVN